MITAALENKLADVAYVQHPVFGLLVPQSCENVPSEVLNPKNTWSDKEAYDAKAMELANSFKKNFAQFEEFANEEIIAGGPTV
ncbi:predicted protein [Nematostella vectensis]|uniref:Phosphoenolpyruvate carboxykinase (ATP) n=1 Tax=Nematostella vectensis TaxID=45351 RepID=A7T990_NEMVE|nr:predicted protein [Nematostella vectensis]|eukprot:XP_001619538.1 hypothetical protein NEMVEDRAFT_v1g151042 [Nematostella vectensis]